MTDAQDTATGWHGRQSRGARLRHLRRPLLTGVTVLVWLIAIGAALHLYQRIGVAGTINGFADDQPVTLAHFEPGVVRGVHVQLYDQVTHGQVLVSLDDREERIQLAAIQRDVDRLRAEIAAAQARLSTDDARARADVDDLLRRFVIDRESAHIDYLSQLVVDARDRILLRGMMVEYEIIRDLHDCGAAAFRELNDIQTDADALRAEIAERAELLLRLKDAFRAADQRWGRFVAQADVATPFEAVLTPLRLAADVRERELEQIVHRIDSHVLRAPIDGHVTTLLAHPGDRVSAGSVLAEISPRTTNRVVAYLPQQMVLSAQVGSPVTVRCLAEGGRGKREYAGTIIRLSATVTEAPPRFRLNPAYPLWGRGLVIALNDDEHLIPGEALAVWLSERR